MIHLQGVTKVFLQFLDYNKKTKKEQYLKSIEMLKKKKNEFLDKIQQAKTEYLPILCYVDKFKLT